MLPGPHPHWSLRTISRCPYQFFPQMASQFFCLHDSPSNLAESRYPEYWRASCVDSKTKQKKCGRLWQKKKPQKKGLLAGSSGSISGKRHTKVRRPSFSWCWLMWITRSHHLRGLPSWPTTSAQTSNLTAGRCYRSEVGWRPCPGVDWIRTSEFVL